MRRYFRPIGTISAGEATITTYLVIRTDEVPPHQVLAAGFTLIDARLTDAEVLQLYGVSEILEVRDDRPMGPVN